MKVFNKIAVFSHNFTIVYFFQKFDDPQGGHHPGKPGIFLATGKTVKTGKNREFGQEGGVEIRNFHKNLQNSTFSA